MKPNKLIVSDPVAGFTERESNSKALLNTDVQSLLKYKIQRRRLNGGSQDIEKVKSEVNEIKNELSEIKALLLKITESRN